MNESKLTGQTTAELVTGGFARAGAWHRHETSGSIVFKGSTLLPRDPGVYAYAVGGVVRYVGSAQRGLRTRLRHYEIAKTLRTVDRIRQEILPLLINGGEVEVFIIVPPPLNVNDLPIDVIAGLEEGLIKAWQPEWSRRGKGEGKKTGR